MVRHWWRLIYGPWLLLYLALTLVLLIPALHSVLWLPFGVWLAKPVLDRLVLFILSRAMFGTNPSPSQALRQFLHWSWSWSTLLEMTLLRLRPDRVIILSIDMLEGSYPTERDHRKRIIQHHLRADAFGVSLVFVLFEAIVVSGLYLFYFLIFPNHENPEVVYGLDVTVVLSIGYVIAVGLLETFYVGVNFSLYLNLRTKLESWDLRIAFQQIRARWDKQRVRSVVTHGAALLMLVMGTGVELQAQDEEIEPVALHEMRNELPKAWELRQDANKILAGPPFNKRREKFSTWVPRWENNYEPKVAPKSSGSIFSTLAIYLFYAVAATVVLSLLVFVVSGLLKAVPESPESGRFTEDRVAAPAFHAILGEEPLPQDILRAARADYAQGNLRKAMSYLFRGALARLAESGSIKLAEFATEGECVRAVRRNLGGDFSTYFGDLVMAWQMVAYGHRHLDEQSFEALCQGWKQHLSVRK